PTSASCPRSSSRAWLRRDIIAPIGIWRISAASLYENSRTSTSKRTSRSWVHLFGILAFSATGLVLPTPSGSAARRTLIASNTHSGSDIKDWLPRPTRGTRYYTGYEMLCKGGLRILV